MASEIIDLTREIFLPEDIKQNWLLPDGVSVPHLFQFMRFPPPPMLYYCYANLSHLLHKEDVPDFDPEILLQFGPPSQQLLKKYTDAIKTAPPPIHSFTLVHPSGSRVKFPTWVFDYWRDIGRAVIYRHDWEKALVWLREKSQSESMVEICDQVVAGLSFFPWNGGYCTVHDMASILTDSWLSDYHIDFGLNKISSQYCHHYGPGISSCHIFLQVMDIDSIIKTHATTVPSGNPGHKRRQFLEIEEKITNGLVDSVAGGIHLPGHWTSLVIEFNPPKILYGDSLGDPMPPEKAYAFKQWMCYLLSQSGQGVLRSDIPIHQLETMNQPDLISCGLFTLNAIGHYYLPQVIPLLQPDPSSMAYYRLEIALELLQAGAVSL